MGAHSCNSSWLNQKNLNNFTFRRVSTANIFNVGSLAVKTEIISLRDRVVNFYSYTPKLLKSVYFRFSLFEFLIAIIELKAFLTSGGPTLKCSLNGFLFLTIIDNKGVFMFWQVILLSFYCDTAHHMEDLWSKEYFYIECCSENQ